MTFLTILSERAGLFLNVQSTATEARDKVQGLKNLKNKFEPQKQMELTGDRNESNMVIQSNEGGPGESGITRYTLREYGSELIKYIKYKLGQSTTISL